MSSLFLNLCTQLQADERITATCFRLVVVLFERWAREDFPPRIRITRRILMQQTRIKSFTTYDQGMRDLVAFGYLIYEPSYHPALGSRIGLIIPGTIPHTPGFPATQPVPLCVPPGS